MIQLENVDFSYRKQVQVLHSINLDIRPGNIYGLLGKNGEGKTTLLNLLSGLIFPDKGTCRVFDKEPKNRDVDFLQKIFLLPEDIYLPDVTAIEYIKMHAPLYPTFNDTILKTCIESFEVNLNGRISKMSLGQKKKVAIMLALSAHTPLLLMDEPTNGLDIPSKSIFRKLIASFIAEDQTVLISTHQVRDLESLIDSVIILNNKEILLNRSLDEISSKLDFRKLQPGEEALYSEASPVGNIGVVKNVTEEKSTVSLELLFNAAILPPSNKVIKQMFNQ